ncbi:DnaB-like helicase C-terminal domain-containing protein [Paracoccus litorisediminis]|uniref:DNA helicase n=1 Tax=Paracoccus litorisediminis TaxID=2006130 RepID=A0A844HSN7_9RHOB|nr:DnaB-like helicase C-terminal domain-containing protein [Paracoccus litorisediminis]MTH61225.1 DNA helicase [Paracoccus litorisediminis]
MTAQGVITTAGATPAAAPTATFNFDETFQLKIAAAFSRDTTFAKRVTELIDPGYFTNAAVGEFVRINKDHLTQFGAVPDSITFVKLLTDLVAAKRVRPDLLQGIKDAYVGTRQISITGDAYLAQEIETFAKHQALQNAMMEAIPLLDVGKFDKIEEIMRRATQVGLADDFEEYNYFAKVAARTEKREMIATGVTVSRGISSGYAEIDNLLYHKGWGRKELACIMGPAKSGKSLSLGDFAKNAALAGHNVLYVSLEVAKEIISERIDASISDTLMSELVQDRAKIEAIVQGLEAQAGVFEVIDFPSGSLKVSALDHHIERYRAKGIVFDMIVVDYGDIMCPEVRSEKLQDGLRQIYIDLRALMHKWNAAGLTATQTNREGAKAVTAKATDVGDDFNKVRTVDILIGLNATDAEKAAGEARLYWAASRNTADGFTVRINQDRAKMKFLTKVIGVEH